MSKDTQIEGLEEIAKKHLGIGLHAPHLLRFLADPAILALIPAVKALQEENERLSGLSKEYFGKLNGWQEAYIKAERTLLLAGFADEGGELWKPPLGPSASPLLDRIATLEAQLAGGEAVAWRPIFNIPSDFTTGKPSQETIDYWADQGVEIEYAYTAAPAIKQQVAEDYLLIELGHGNIEIGDGHLEGVPAIVFGRNGNGRVGEQLTFTDREMAPGETIACITFANIAGLDVLQMKMDSLRSHMLAEAPTHPVSANQPDGGWERAINFVATRIQPTDAAQRVVNSIVMDMKAQHFPSANQPDSGKVPPGYALVPLRLTPAMLDILDQDDWQWEDVLAAAEAITEEQYNEIAASPSAQIAEGDK